MNNRINFFIILSFMAALVSCDQSKNFEKTATGLKYKIYTENKGDKLKEGEVVSLVYSMKNSKDSLFDSHLDKKNPLSIPLRKAPFKGSIEEGLFLLTKGDSATFLVSADSMFKGNPLPPFIKAGTDIAFDVRILNVQSPEQYQKERMESMQKERVKIEGDVKKHVAIDDSLIVQYLNKNNIKATKTSSGLYYQIEKQGSGEKPAAGDTVKVNYKGYLLNGKVFDANTFDFPIGIGAVIPGWDEGLMLLKEGSKAKLFIPSAQAYGYMQKSADIVPFSVLAFDVELLDVKKKKK